MANTTSVYERTLSGSVERLTVMAYLGHEEGDADEIRVIHDRGGVTVEDGIAYHGRQGVAWLEDHRRASLAGGYRPARLG
ncbi:hypothetical protein AMIS_25480 [Actinoplanes missouriensis 431]|uniref:Uncharacterized protein n=1 Tax=Actinoplanes missouriensis (strain ATCC 14538 / DSM 43046 / CBS 188.64 / JCM 3121 / NBRC 102363 / NCIMB 12654 / NRRL B-3342 / UNCC 431) TaxID=512565 RepID=I0H431_ACTM4|nr:hypothetical protein [Actinoplanes missouriensis]BAL87768.1 hypothetical protein AMIS_25480 [Actinoplanes missouriensis 431]